MDVGLFCNYKRCQVPLTSTAWVTVCSHIFCNDHFPNNCDTDKKCPLCYSDISGRYDLFQTNLNPSEEHRSMVLAGFSPTTIIEIGWKAIAFWNFQKFHEKMYLESTVRHVRSRLAQAESHYGATTERLKDLIQQETQKCENFQKELNNYIKKTTDLEAKLENKNKYLYNLHMKYESLRKRNNEHHSIEQMNTKQYRSNNRLNVSPNYLSQIPSFEDEPTYSSQRHPTTSRSMFTFCPTTSLGFTRENQTS